MPDQSTEKGNSRPPERGGKKSRFAWFQPLRRHAIFPVLVFIVASEIIRENYPFSHFPMYARPSSGTLTYCYVTDGDRNPVPLMWHTGITPARTSKMLGFRVQEVEEDERRRKKEDDGPPRTDAQIRAEAGAEVLKYLRHMNSKREKRPLPEKIKLVEVTVGYGDGGFTERPEAIAESP